jgi:hypothetical protein
VVLLYWQSFPASLGNCSGSSTFPALLTAYGVSVLENEVIWGILVCRLKLDRSLSRSEQVKLY